jgi:hypothetical protein
MELPSLVALLVAFRALLGLPQLLLPDAKSSST